MPVCRASDGYGLLRLMWVALGRESASPDSSDLVMEA